jgi:hypothetical protein
MGLVRGEDVILSAYQYLDVDNNGWVPFGCARSVTFDISTDFIETSVTESGAFKTFIPSGKQFSGNIEGLVFLDKPASFETKATNSALVFTQFVDDFPTLFSEIFIQAQLPNGSYVTLANQYNFPYTTFNDFINAANNLINSSGTGFTSAISGNIITITAAPDYGASMNGQLCIYSIQTGTVPNLIGSAPFGGGTSGYFPDKLGIGFMYDKLMSGTPIQLKYYETDDDNHFLQKECGVYFESINETSSFDNMVTFTAQFKGSGAPIITYGEI